MGRKGLPPWAIKEARKRGARNVFAYAWSLVKRGARRARRATRKGNPCPKTKRRGNPNMATRKRARSFFSTRTVFKFIRIGALVAPAFQRYQETKRIDWALTQYAGLGHDGKFYWSMLQRAWTPFVMATLVTYGVQKLGGIIRRL